MGDQGIPLQWDCPLTTEHCRQEIGTAKSVTKSFSTEKIAGSRCISDSEQGATPQALLPTDWTGNQATVAIQHRQAVEVTVPNQTFETGTEATDTS